MQKNNLNVIVFDDDQDVQNEPVMAKYTSHSMKSIHQDNKSDVLVKQINNLQQKIKRLQNQGDKIKRQFSKIDNNNINNSNVTAISPNFKEIDHLLMVVQKKIQLVVQESRKMLQKITQSFDKKLAQKSKNDPSLKFQAKSQQIQKLYAQRIEQNQRQYKQELQKVVLHNKNMQTKMMQKLSFIQQKYLNKINDFQTKQKQYVDWIHHLQAKIKQNKNKKMIQITQQKPSMSRVQSKTVIPIQVESNGPNNLENRPNMFNHPINVSAQNKDGSRVHRKHKIFGNNNRSSVSPAPKDVTPPKNNNINFVPTDKTKIIVKPQTDKSWNLSNVNEDGQTAKTNFGFSKQLRSANESQFYRDVPKPGHGWDKFADIDVDDDLDSESEDDFFYPAQSRNTLTNRQDQSTKVLNQIPIQSRHNQNFGSRGQTYKPILNNWSSPSNNNQNDKIFSPFDMN